MLIIILLSFLWIVFVIKIKGTILEEFKIVLHHLANFAVRDFCFATFCGNNLIVSNQKKNLSRKSNDQSILAFCCTSIIDSARCLFCNFFSGRNFPRLVKYGIVHKAGATINFSVPCFPIITMNTEISYRQWITVITLDTGKNELTHFLLAPDLVMTTSCYF